MKISFSRDKEEKGKDTYGLLCLILLLWIYWKRAENEEISVVDGEVLVGQ